MILTYEITVPFAVVRIRTANWN